MLSLGDAIVALLVAGISSLLLKLIWRSYRHLVRSNHLQMHIPKRCRAFSERVEPYLSRQRTLYRVTYRETYREPI